MDDIEDLAALAALPPDDPRRREAEARPGVAARLRAYEEFAAPGDLPPSEKLAEAEERLGALLEREIGVEIPGAVRARPPARRAVLEGSWLARLLAPPRRPLLAAAVVIVVAGSGLVMTLGRRDSAPVYRGGETTGARGGWEARLVSSPLPSGGVRLTWAPAAGADGYAVVFLSADLVEVARVSGVRETAFALAPGTLPAGLASGAEVLWRVVALRGADEIGSSPTQPVRVP